MKKLFTAFAISFLAILPTVLAQTAIPGGDVISSILGIPADWLVFPAFIYQFIIPFAALFVIVYGLVKQLRIFDRPRNFAGIISFLIAFSTLGPSSLTGFFDNSAFYQFVAGSLAYMGAFAYGIFILLFFVGGGLYFWKRTNVSMTEAGVFSAYRSQQGELNNRLSTLEENLTGTMRDIARETNPDRREELERRAQAYRTEIADIESRLRELERLRPS